MMIAADTLPCVVSDADDDLLRAALADDVERIRSEARRDRLRSAGWLLAAVALAVYGQWAAAAPFGLTAVAWFVVTERRTYWAYRLVEARSNEH